MSNPPKIVGVEIISIVINMVYLRSFEPTIDPGSGNVQVYCDATAKTRISVVVIMYRCLLIPVNWVACVSILRNPFRTSSYCYKSELFSIYNARFYKITSMWSNLDSFSFPAIHPVFYPTLLSVGACVFTRSMQPSPYPMH